MDYLGAGMYWFTHIGGSGTIVVDGEEFNLQTGTGNFLIFVKEFAEVNTTEVKYIKVPSGTISIGG